MFWPSKADGLSPSWGTCLRGPKFFRLVLDATDLRVYLICMAISKNNRLAQYRRRAALMTQKELSELSGVPIRTIQDQEAGIIRSPRLDTARKLIKALESALKMNLTIDDVWPERYNG